MGTTTTKTMMWLVTRLPLTQEYHAFPLPPIIIEEVRCQLLHRRPSIRAKRVRKSSRPPSRSTNRIHHPPGKRSEDNGMPCMHPCMYKGFHSSTTFLHAGKSGTEKQPRPVVSGSSSTPNGWNRRTDGSPWRTSESVNNWRKQWQQQQQQQQQQRIPCVRRSILGSPRETSHAPPIPAPARSTPTPFPHFRRKPCVLLTQPW